MKRLPGIKKWTALCAAFFCGFTLLTGPVPVSMAETAAAFEYSEENQPFSSVPYRHYISQYQDQSDGTGEIIIEAADFEHGEADIQPSYEGEAAVVILSENAPSLTYRFSVKDSGLYRLGALYFPLSDGSMLDANLAFQIDGVVPFDEAETVFLSKIYADETDIRQDRAGNDLRPRQIEKPRWRYADFIDKSGFNPEPFKIYLTAGTHTLTVSMAQQSVALKHVVVYGESALPSYAEVEEQYGKQDLRKGAGATQKFQAEKAYEKSSADISPTAVTFPSNAVLEPSDPMCTRLNVIDSVRPADWISWKITPEVSGLYQIGMRVLQNGNRGVNVSRRLYINGQVPFAEANCIEFPFSDRWYNAVIGGDEPYWFYFEAGREYVLTLECTTGRMAPVISTVQDAVLDLNDTSRRITQVTGLTPDLYRDYDFAAEIPDLFERLKRAKDQLQSVLDSVEPGLVNSGSAFVTVEDLIRQLDQMLDKPRSIPGLLDNFRVNISSLGSWVRNMTNQSLTMDTIVLLPEGAQLEKANASFFEQLSFDIRAIIGSFFIDYNTLGGDVKNQHITAWSTATGRDQVNIIRQLIDNDFMPKNDVSVSLSLIKDSATLLQATLSGKGPDIAMFVEKTLPVNLAARGALTELSRFSRFDEISHRFYQSAMIPYEFNNGIYAVPDAQSFNMMFCRTDILKEMGLSPPDTWDDFYRLLAVLQRANMQVGIGTDQGMFETLILQHGGQLYHDDLNAVTFDTQETLDAFRMWTGFFSEYSSPQTYDILAYFRSGMMPVVIAGYSTYNLLSFAAPEINGLWEMFPIPGFSKSDGSVDRRETATGTAAILMKSAKNQQAAFDFLDWWTSTETQTRFSLDVEAIAGPGARYTSANKEVLGNLAWRREEYTMLNQMWENVWDFPTLPSGYYIARNVNNAFRAVVYKDENPREVLNKYARIINKEIIRKNKELGMSTERGTDNG